MSDAFKEYEAIGRTAHDKGVVSTDLLDCLSVKLYEDIMANREEILRAFIAETGLLPSEVEQVFEPSIRSWSVRKKTEPMAKRTIENAFILNFKQIQLKVHSTAREKGWWDEERNDGELICLMHSELSEALEALRHGNPPDDKIPEFTGEEAELGDVVIRIMDYAEKKNLRVAEAIIAKTEMNKTRKYKHGNKSF